MCRDPHVQRGHANTQIASNELIRQSAGQSNAHRVLAKFGRSFWPLVNLLCSRNAIKGEELNHDSCISFLPQACYV